MQDFTEISYVIDAEDRLVSVSDGWTSFARMNHGEALSPEKVIGHSLWEFIADEPTRELYADVLARVRAGTETDLILRCDGPELRRLIEIMVAQQMDGMVRFRTVLLASKPRPLQRLFDRATPRSTRHIMVCSWCEKVNVDIEKWFEVEAAMDYLHLNEEVELPVLDPVVCPECYSKVSEIIGSSTPMADLPASA